jgi:HEAT repeat protein
MPLVRKKEGRAPPPPPPPTEATLRTGTKDQRWSAAREMSDVGALGRALQTEQDISVREAILTSLCRIATPESAGMIVPSVRSDNASIRRGALDALISIPAAAAPHLGALLADTDADVRLLSCEIARALPSERATALLCDLLKAEAVANVCTAAVDVLAEIGTVDALPVLRDLTQRFQDEQFLQFAANAAIETIADTRRA